MPKRQPIAALSCRICDAPSGKPHLKGCPCGPSTGGTGNKYSARPTDCGQGHVHPSAKEARRCAQLTLLQRAGEISDLEREPVYEFTVNGRLVVHDGGRPARFRPDFRYRLKDGRLVVEDSKGMRVRDWPLRKALFRACYPDIEVIES